ncbi:MAG TPA: hypothetical protein DHV07_05010 [Flavobacteriales bacterium]|jgi:hypothetical protein|nr:hypothetical protein [Flavobacteriales bacterium]
MGADNSPDKEGAFAARKLALIDAVLSLEQEEDLGTLESSVQALQESIRARQLVIGYLPNGNVVLKQRFLDRLRHTLQDLNHDEYVTLPELEQRAADW